jgi:glycosyltransferase involved in cell wall biosynthesis
MTSLVPSAVHVNDAAFTAHRLIAQARARGYRWDFLPRATRRPGPSGPTAMARETMAGARWLARLKREQLRHDVVHIHSGTVLQHSRMVTRRYVLNCHGSDVRTQQYEPRWQTLIRTGLVEAEAVFYPTPELAEHVLPHRADAVYLPIPVDVANLPRWQPAVGRPQVLFASRWSSEKGGDVQLATALELVRAVGARVDVIGLDWGPGAAEAASLGVRLLPRMPHRQYLELLAASSVVIGQSAGILATSELEALGMGAPLVLPVPMPWYEPTGAPLHGGSVSEAVDATVALLEHPQAHDAAASVRYIDAHHGVEHAVDTVAAVYHRVVAAR